MSALSLASARCGVSLHLRDGRTDGRRMSVRPSLRWSMTLSKLWIPIVNDLLDENLCEGGAPTFLPNRARSGLNLALVSGPQVQHRGRRTVATAVLSPYVQVYTCLLLSDLPMDAVSCYRRTLYTC